MPKKPKAVAGGMSDGGDDVDLSLNMRLVLEGFMAGVGGPEEFGRELARLFKSPDTSPTTKSTTGVNMMKIMAAFGEETGDDMVPDELVDRWEKLREAEAKREAMDSE